MAKFPLVMADGEQVRDMKGLRTHFDLAKAVGYFLDGKLLTWLNNYYYEDEAEQVGQLASEDSELGRKLCQILGVEYVAEQQVDTEEMVVQNERLAKLKQFTDDEEILKNVDSVAFNQEELAELYDKGKEKIYLCEGCFTIPKSKQELEYVELGGAQVAGKKQVNKVSAALSMPLNGSFTLKLNADRPGSRQGELFICKSNGDKELVATGVRAFAHNFPNIFYVDFHDEIKKYSLETKQPTTILPLEKITNVEALFARQQFLFCNENVVVWSDGISIVSFDHDGDFPNIAYYAPQKIVEQRIQQNMFEQVTLHDDLVYFIVGNEHTLMRISLTEKIPQKVVDADLYCISNDKIIGALCIKSANPSCRIFQCDANGAKYTSIKTIAHRVVKITTDNEFIYITYNEAGSAVSAMVSNSHGISSYQTERIPLNETSEITDSEREEMTKHIEKVIQNLGG